MKDKFSMKDIGDIPISAIDFETTGLDPNTDAEICEVGVAIIKERRIVDEYSSFVRIVGEMPFEAYQVHGISDEDLEDAPSLKTVMDEFLEITKNSIFIAHNRDFDLSFLNIALTKIGCNEIDKPFLDLLEITRKLLPDLENYKLITIANSLKIDVSGLHRALGDARTTAEVFIKMADNLNLWSEKVSKLEMLSEHPKRKDVHPLILNALSEHKRISISYETAKGSISQRIVRPIRLTEDNRMLVAFCFLSEDRRNFRLDRIIDIKEYFG
jgi:DNA polymerase III epsilon subunit family exonuclease